MPRDADAVKRSVRRLKRLECAIRFGGSRPEGAALVWDSFFDLRETGAGKARYPLPLLAAMGKEEFQRVVDEYFAYVYDRFYRENGLTDVPIYDAGLLARLGLPTDADTAAVKKRFHELALKHHPDTGGDPGKFIELMDSYRKLIEKGK